MSLTAVGDNQLIIAAQSKLLLLTKAEIGDNWSSQIFELDRNAPVLSQKPRKYLPDTEDDEPGDNKPPEPEFLINNVAVSLSLNFVAISTIDKTVFLFRFLSDDGTINLQFLSRRKIARNTSCLRFGMNDILFVSDKAGDIYTFSCSNPEEPGQWILGHISQILDLMVDEKYVVTSDRDEKIKISHYPNAHEIESFCLGHKEFVSSVGLVTVSSNKRKVLVSGSGDCTIRFWEYPTGRQQFEVSTESPVGSLVVRDSVDLPGKAVMAVLLRRPDQVQLYKIDVTDEEKVKCEPLGDVVTFGDSFVISIVLTSSQLHALTFNKEKGLELRSRTLTGEETNFSVPQETFKTSELKFEDCLENLYKKKIDNVAEYHERKRRRIEQQQQKGKTLKT